MKKSKVFVLSFVFALIASFNLSASPAGTNPTEVRKEIVNYITDMDLTNLEADVEKVQIQFLVNSKNEIVVLNISETTLETAIKSKLNYKKIKTEEATKNKIYSVPVVFKKK